MSKVTADGDILLGIFGTEYRLTEQQASDLVNEVTKALRLKQMFGKGDVQPTEQSVCEYNKELFIEDGRTIFLDGYFYDVFIEVYDDMSIDVTHKPVYYTCWDGEFPF